MSDPVRLALVVSDVYSEITSLMLTKACEHAKFLGAIITYIARSPGTYDAPFLLKQLLERDDVDAAVTLGAVIEGETNHDDIVAQQSARKFIDLSLEYGKPVTLGVSGPGMTRLQAQKRIDKFATDAVEGAVKLVRRKRMLSEATGKNYPIILD